MGIVKKVETPVKEGRDPDTRRSPALEAEDLTKKSRWLRMHCGALAAFEALRFWIGIVIRIVIGIVISRDLGNPRMILRARGGAVAATKKSRAGRRQRPRFRSSKIYENNKNTIKQGQICRPPGCCSFDEMQW